MEKLLVIASFVCLVKTDSPNQIVFSHLGKTTKEASYGHLVVQIPIKEVQAAADSLFELCDAVNRNSDSEGFRLANER